MQTLMMIVYQVFHYARLVILVPIRIGLFVVRIAWRTLQALWWMFTSVARPALRFISFVALIVAIVALVADLTPALSGTGPLDLTSLAEQWARLAPNSLAAAREAVSVRLQPWIWDYGIALVLNLPTFLLFGLFSAFTSHLGRRRQMIDVFVN